MDRGCFTSLKPTTIRTEMKNLNSILLAAVFGAASLHAAPVVQLRLHADQPVVPSGREGTVLVKVEVEGGEAPAADRAPVNLSLVIDKSGSMAGERIEQARRGAIEAVRRLGPDDFVSVVVYDSEVRTLVPSMKATDIGPVERAIRGIQASGMTNIYGGVEAGLAELEKNKTPEQLSRLILLSDGLANVGRTNPRDFADLGRRLSSSGVVVSTIGLGEHYNERLMADLAQAGEGNHYFVDRPSTLPKIFETEIGHLVRTVARGTTITIEVPGPVRIEGVRGRPFRSSGNRIEIDFHDLVAGQRKFSFIELAVPSGEEGAKLPPIRAEARFVKAAAGGGESRVAADCVLRFSGSPDEVARAARPDVQTAWAVVYAAEVQDEVLDLVQAGRREEAVALLDEAPAQAVERGLSRAAQELEDFREEEQRILSQRDFTADESRARRAEAYSTRNQQMATP